MVATSALFPLLLPALWAFRESTLVLLTGLPLFGPIACRPASLCIHNVRQRINANINSLAENGQIHLPRFNPNVQPRPTLQHLRAQPSAVSLPSGVAITLHQTTVPISVSDLLISFDTTMNSIDAQNLSHRPSLNPLDATLPDHSQRWTLSWGTLVNMMLMIGKQKQGPALDEETVKFCNERLAMHSHFIRET